MKSVFFFFLAILSQVALASEWSQTEVNKNGYHLRVSYTKTYLPATYGSNGGVVTGEAYVELFTSAPGLAEKVEIYQPLNNGQYSKSKEIRLNENHSRHFWAKLSSGPSYADYIYVGAPYVIRVIVDGRYLDFQLKLN